MFRRRIDWWLLYCLVTLIVTFLFHTIIGHIHDKEKHILTRMQKDNTRVVPFGSVERQREGRCSSSRLNAIGIVVVLLLMITVNACFWYKATKEYLRKPSEFFKFDL